MRKTILAYGHEGEGPGELLATVMAQSGVLTGCGLLTEQAAVELFEQLEPLVKGLGLGGLEHYRLVYLANGVPFHEQVWAAPPSLGANSVHLTEAALLRVVNSRPVIRALVVL